MNEKLRLGFISNAIFLKTGLSRNVKATIPILYKTGKYEIYMLNQAIGDGDPNYVRLPWHNEGAMKNFDQQRFNSDGNYQRFVSYGNAAVEEWVTKNKLDVVIALDDAWGFDLGAYIKTDWYNHMKDNFMFDITLDSEPIIGQGKELAKNCPNFRVWSGFAERVLKKEDPEEYGHVKTLRGAIDSEQFKPLHRQERLDLRRKFGISDDEKIIFYLGRNQLRKNSFHGNQEALALWKKKHPEKKLRLLFHTKFNEPSGWHIDQIRQELGLNKEDILSTYFCRQCIEWNIQPYEGEDINCPFCKGERKRVTAGIDSPIDEHDLNKIYNLADACCSSFTSGGQEYNLVESMLAGLPLACPFYSSGEDFILSGFVREIKGSFYREFNTSFKKFTPDINSILEFYEYVWNLRDIDRQNLVKSAREWAIKEFDAKNIAKQLEEFIDSCKPINWDAYFNRKKDIKNVNVQVENKQTDEEFIKHCYSTILNMTVDNNDSGYIHWSKFLAQSADKQKLRDELVNCFRRAGQEHNKKVQPQIPFESLLLDNGKKNFLLVCKESAGDILYATAILESLRKNYPIIDWNIYFACDEHFMELLDGNPYIDKVLPYLQFMEQEIQCTGAGARKGMFSGYCHLTVNTQRQLSYLTNNNINIIV
jgi:glycosyltransferase involved in cell wall biosynthesis